MKGFLAFCQARLRVWLNRWRYRHQVDAEEPVVIGQFYQRSGSCNQCAQCCREIYLTFGRELIKTVEDHQRIAQAHPEYVAFEPIEQTDKGLVFRCTNLQADNTCGIYETRPNFCRTYPNEDGLLGGGKLPAECSYRFTLLKTFAQVLADSPPPS